MDMPAASSTATRCPACAGHELETFFTLLERAPMFCHVLATRATEAQRVAKADIVLALCPGCGMITNTCFDPADIADVRDFEDSSHHSQRFRAYADGLIQMLVRNHALDGKDVIEIGCGKGDFLARIATRSTARCVGFDKRYDGEQEYRELPNLRFVRDEFSPLLYDECRADLVILRHVLEHTAKPHEVLATLRSSLPEGANFYVEVPNTMFLLREHRIWGVVYERCGYFTESSLRATLQRAGFEPTNIHASFGGELLCAEGHIGPARTTVLPRDAVDETRAYTDEFAVEFERTIRAWNDLIALRLRNGERIAVWGAGSKGVTFVNLIDHTPHLAAVVDLNERKHGKFVPGTSQQIISPEELRHRSIDTILVMSQNYEDEIRAQLRDYGLHCEVLVV